MAQDRVPESVSVCPGVEKRRFWQATIAQIQQILSIKSLRLSFSRVSCPGVTLLREQLLHFHVIDL